MSESEEAAVAAVICIYFYLNRYRLLRCTRNDDLLIHQIII